MDKEEKELKQHPLNEEPAAENTEKKEEEDGNCLGSILFMILVAAVIWALIHFNPSEEEHHEKIKESLTEAVADIYTDGYSPDYRQIAKISDAKYHSLGVCSWTTVRYRGQTSVTSIGILGWVCPLF
ncbi:MAG: hypothetical protein K2F70_01720 [Muribaculaceae bacterium]|nr:hypothetical protein [Muribaculaceae bacterium]